MKYSSLGLLFLAFNAFGAGFEIVKSCLIHEYEKLTNRNAINVALLDAQQTELMSFGKGHLEQVFEIGSLTKTFTAVLLAQDLEEKKLNLSDPIPAEYQKIPFVMTYEDLVTHTSGLTGGLFPDFQVTNEYFPFEGLTLPLFKELYKKTPLSHAPKSRWEYSNIGISVLGLALSESHSETYERLALEKILLPLGLSNTSFEVPKELMWAFPEGSIKDPSGNSLSMLHWDLFQTAINPAGGIRSTIADMAKYARANLFPEPVILGNALKRSHERLYFASDKNLWMGMVWVIDPVNDFIWHNGRTYGFNSILVLSEKNKQAVVALTDTNIILENEKFDDSLQNIAFRCLKD